MPEDPCVPSNSPFYWVWHPLANELTRSDPEGRYSGKWLLFPNCSEAASVWTVTHAATPEGSLGIGAKITAEQARSPGGPHMICVYTDDWRDLEDVARVGLRLVSLGLVPQAIYYKADDQTRAGQYASSGLSSIYRLRPPYEHVEASGGLPAFAQSYPEAKAISERLGRRVSMA